MNDQALKQLIQQGLSAMKAGGQVAKEATSEIQNDVSNEQLAQNLQQGSETSEKWYQRIDQAFQEAGGQQQQDNEIMQAHYKVSKKIRQQAPDDYSRDLGIIASGQLALHYWIASFGTMHAYCKQAGMNQSAENMGKCLQEARQADEKQTEIAQQIMK